MDGAYHSSIVTHPTMSSELVLAPRRLSVSQLTSQNGHGHRKGPSAIELPKMSHRHHSQLPHNYPGPAYPPSNYHPTSRHVSNGPPPPGMMAAPQNMPMSGPPEPMPHMSNGHGHSHATHAPQMSAAARIGKENMEKTLAQLANANENTWMLIGKCAKYEVTTLTYAAGAVAEQVQDQDKALRAFETALKHNPNSVLALNAVASIARSRDDFDKAIEYFQRILNIKQDNGEVWGSMGERFALPMPCVVLTKLRTLSIDEG